MKHALIAAFAGLALFLPTAAFAAETRVQVGVLSCEVEGGVGLLIGSSKNMVCEFKRRGHDTEEYDGTIDKLGLDIGITGQTQTEWLVFSDAGRGLE